MVRRREPIDWVPYDGDRVAAVRPSVRVLQSEGLLDARAAALGNVHETVHQTTISLINVSMCVISVFSNLTPRLDVSTYARAIRSTRLSNERMRSFHAVKKVFDSNDIVGLILSYTGLDEAVNIIQTCKAFRTLSPIFAHMANLIVCYSDGLAAVKQSLKLLEQAIELDGPDMTEQQAEENAALLSETRDTEISFLKYIRKATFAQLCVVRAVI